MIKESIAALPERRRWRVHLAVISAPLLIVFLASFDSGTGHFLPGRLAQLPAFIAAHTIAWASCLALGFLISEVSEVELRLPHPSWAGVMVRGILWSVVLRLSLAPVLALAHLLIDSDHLMAFSARMREVLNLENLSGKPFQALVIYATLAVVAGLFEELWRAGFLAGLRHLYPRAFASRAGTFAMIAVTAGLFGLGHLYQGALGVVVTFTLGLGLGCIMVRRNSYWEAAFAHMAFDATSFALAYHLATRGLHPEG